MRTATRWTKQKYAINSSTWTQIVAPLDYDYVGFRCDSSDCIYRTDEADAGTEDALPATAQDGVMGGLVGRVFANLTGIAVFARFPQGYVLCSVKSVKPTATLVVSWVL